MTTPCYMAYTFVEKVCCCEIGILSFQIAHILRQGINGFLERAHRERLGE